MRKNAERYHLPPMKARIIVEQPCDISGWKLIVRHMDGCYYSSSFMNHVEDQKYKTYYMDGDEFRVNTEIDVDSRFKKGISQRYQRLDPEITGTAFFLTIEFERVSDENLEKIEILYKDIRDKYPSVPCKFVIVDPEDEPEKVIQINQFSQKLGLKPNFVKVKLDGKQSLSDTVEDLFEQTIREALIPIKKYEKSLENKLMLDSTKKAHKLQVWHESSKYKDERAEFEQIWKNPNHTSDKEKILACMMHYTKDNSALFRFFSGCWNRTHIDEVAAIYTLSTKKDASTLLKELKDIKLINSEGTCATMIEFISEQLKQPEYSNGTSCTI